MKIKLSGLIVASFLGLVFLAVLYFVWPKPEAIVISGHQFNVENVFTEKDRERGLGGREALCDNCAMVFHFPEKGIHPFWMKDMRFDIDIIWISGQKVVHVAKGESRNPEKIINPGVEADIVVEINAGMSEKYGIRPGEKVLFP